MMFKWSKCECLLIGFKTRGNRYVFSQRNQLQIGVVLWLVCATSS